MRPAPTKEQLDRLEALGVPRDLAGRVSHESAAEMIKNLTAVPTNPSQRKNAVNRKIYQEPREASYFEAKVLRRKSRGKYGLQHKKR